MVVIVSLKWCKNQDRGIKLTGPNENLAKEYFANAEETLDILKAITGKSRMWLATTKYYCEYFTVYALLMKLGIKSEIHDCTIALCDFLERERLVPNGTHKRLNDNKQLRIDNQYYLKNRPVEFDYGELVKFVLSIKNIAETVTLQKENELREKLKGLLEDTTFP